MKNPGYAFKKLKAFSDVRGDLVSIEGNNQVPFEIKRIYYLFNSSDCARGFHAHKNLKQFLICISGSCTIKLVSNLSEQTFSLNDPCMGLYIFDVVWREIFDMSKDCVLLVLASDIYNPDDYISNFDEFKRFVSHHDS